MRSSGADDERVRRPPAAVVGRCRGQQALAATPLAAQTPSLPGPYAQLVLNNGGGNKLDYYLARKVEYSGGQCSSDGTRKSTVKVTLTNTAPNEAIGLAGSQPGLVNRTITYTHLPIGGGYGRAIER